MPDFSLPQWKRVLAIIVVVDLLTVGGIFYYVVTLTQYSLAASSAEATRRAVAAVTVLAGPTPWAGPGPRPTPTPTLPATPLATSVLSQSGFPVGFTPTPRPIQTPVMISLPKIYFVGRNLVDVPVVNQIYYPEPFFPPGTNNACGPVALYAALQGLGVKVDYSRLREAAVRYGFNAEGISKAGLVGAITLLNNELGAPLQIEHGNRYGTSSLLKHLRQGGVVVVLVWVRRENGRYVITQPQAGAIGHFLLVERINLRTRKVKLAGSTLGMEQVPLADFLRSWSGNNAQAAPSTTSAWKAYLEKEKAANWALILKRP